MFQINVVEKIKTHILYMMSPPPPCPENVTVCDIMWKNMVEPERPQMTLNSAHALCMLDN
jgi:hypothetical protein